MLLIFREPETSASQDTSPVLNQSVTNPALTIVEAVVHIAAFIDVSRGRKRGSVLFIYFSVFKESSCRAPFPLSWILLIFYLSRSVQTFQIFKCSGHRPKLVFCKVWFHPMVSYRFYSLSNNVEIPVCMDLVRVVFGSHDHWKDVSFVV